MTASREEIEKNLGSLAKRIDLEGNATVGRDELENRFGFHKGTDVTVPQHSAVRSNFIEFACFLDEILPPGRAKSLALTHLEDAAMWANKAIAEKAPLVKE